MTKKKAAPVSSSEEPSSTSEADGLPPPAAAPIAPAPAPAPAAAAADTIDPASPSSEEYTVAFSPRQVAVGFAILAGLIAIAIRSRRRRGRKPADD